MASEIAKAIYGLTSEDKPVTVAGIGYLLRNDFLPVTPVGKEGLQPEHVAAIERFARASQQTGMQD